MKRVRVGALADLRDFSETPRRSLWESLCSVLAAAINASWESRVQNAIQSACSKGKPPSRASLECSLSTISCKPFITSSAFSAVAFTASVMKRSRKAQAAKAESSAFGNPAVHRSQRYFQPAFERSLVPGITMMVSVRFGSREPCNCKSSSRKRFDETSSALGSESVPNPAAQAQPSLKNCGGVRGLGRGVWFWIWILRCGF